MQDPTTRHFELLQKAKHSKSAIRDCHSTWIPVAAVRSHGRTCSTWAFQSVDLKIGLLATSSSRLISMVQRTVFFVFTAFV